MIFAQTTGGLSVIIPFKKYDNILGHLVRDITQSNNGRTRLT